MGFPLRVDAACGGSDWCVFGPLCCVVHGGILLPFSIFLVYRAAMGVVGRLIGFLKCCILRRKCISLTE